MSIHKRLVRTNLAPRNTATAYSSLYKELTSLAKAEDNGPSDSSLRGGEVWLRTYEDNTSTSLGYTSAQSHTPENLTIYQSKHPETGATSVSVSLKAGPTALDGRYLKFEHSWSNDRAPGPERTYTVLLDTETGTLFQAANP